MTRTALALAAAILAGTTLSSAANAGGGIRLGFGFPLGTFIAHPTQNYSSRGYDRPRRYEPPHVARYRDTAPSYRAKRVIPQASVATVTPAPKAAPAQAPVAAATPAKLDGKLPANTTEIAKAATDDAKTTTTPAIDTTTTTAVLSKAPVSDDTAANVTGSSSAVTNSADAADKPATDKVAAVEKTTTETKPAETTDGKRVCRKFSPTIAALVDVPCE